MSSTGVLTKPRQRPMGLRWRCSVWFITLVVTFGICTDLLVYSIITPVLPFQLERLEYSGVSVLVGWLMVSYSAGLVISTIPTAMFSERHRSRRSPLIVGIVILIGSQIMLMEAPRYWLMCLSRILQGVGSSMVWVSGLALLCDTTPEQSTGRQLGIAMSGVSIGFLVGPPVGGALYNRFGFRGPMIFGIITSLLDLAGRLLVIEHQHAIQWDITLPENEKDTRISDDVNAVIHTLPRVQGQDNPPHVSSAGEDKPLGERGKSQTATSLSLVAVIIRLSKSSRALSALFITLIYGLVYTSAEPALPLYVQHAWGLDSPKVGLLFFGAIVPTVLSSPLSGWYADRVGTGYVTVFCLLLALPWWIVLAIRGPLALFVVAFVMGCFFISGVISPLSAELAAVSRGVEGVGYGHVYGAFNLAYGVGASIGPVIGGQLYEHSGWAAVCLVEAGFIGSCVLLAFWFIDEEPLRCRMVKRISPVFGILPPAYQTQQPVALT